MARPGPGNGDEGPGTFRPPSGLQFLPLVAALFLLPPPTALARGPLSQPPSLVKEPDYKLAVSAGLAGQCRMGWVPVSVTVSARRPFDGYLVARLCDPFTGLPSRQAFFETRTRLKLAAGSKDMEYQLYVRHDSPAMAKTTVEVTLEGSGAPRETVQSASLALVSASNYFVCVASEKPSVLAALRMAGSGPSAPGRRSGGSGAERQFTVAQPDLRELPDRVAGYNDVDFLVLYQTPFEKLSDDQRTAICDYAWSGGVVVLCARDRAWFAQKEIRPLAAIGQVRAAERERAERLLATLAGRFGGWGGETSGLGVHEFVFPGSRDDQGFAQARCGLGTVLAWRLDPEDPAVRRWPGLVPLWLEAGRKFYPGKPTDDYGWNQNTTPAGRARALAEKLDLASERSVSGLLMVFLVVLYLVLVGPVNYFALRRLDMRALSIVTVPLLAAVFVLLNFAVGYLSRGVITSARTVTVALASSGASRADCLTRQGVFPAGSMLADVSTDARGLVTPLHDPKGMRQEQAFAAVNEERFTLERHPLRMWEMFYFQAESTRPLGGTVRLADLGGGRFEVTNASAVARRACFVAAGPGGGDFAWMGDLPPNASRQGTLVRWSQKPDFAHNPGTPGAPLSLRDALELWMHDGLGQATSYAPPREESGFAAQAAMVISGDPRLEPARLAHGSRMLLFARAGEELEPLRLDGRRLGGQSADVLVVCAEPGPRP